MYDGEKQTNVIKKDVTLDEWYLIWLNTCKKNCRSSSKESYATHYKRINEDLGWRKLVSLNLVNMQEAINKLKSEKFLAMADGRFYYNLFVLVLEIGMCVGELCGLQWSDVDLKKRAIYVQHTLCYFSRDGKYSFEMHDTKTGNGKRTIPLTSTAIMALKRQKAQKQKLIFEGKEAQEGYENLVFVTKNNQPTQLFLVKDCIGTIIKNIQKEDAGFKHFTPHTFATRAIENGMQPKTLQHILGHGTLKMTMDL